MQYALLVYSSASFKPQLASHLSHQVLPLCLVTAEGDLLLLGPNATKASDGSLLPAKLLTSTADKKKRI